MLRIGKNPKDSAENESSAEKNDVTNYNAPRTFSSYQTPPTPEVKPQSESASMAPRALTESESLAREIKEGNLSGFVGSGTLVTGEANFKALMRVDGHLSGRITSSSGTLIVGANGKVDPKIEGRDAQPLDTSSMKSIGADSNSKPAAIANVSSVSSAAR